MDVIKIFKESWLGKASEYVSDPSKMQGLAKKVTAMFSKEGLQEVLEELKLLVSYVKDVATGKYKDYSVANLAMAVAALIYVASPIDAIPDILPGGLVDDAAVIAWAVNKLHNELNRYKMKK